MEIVLKGESLLLLAEKAIFWPSQQILLIADLHLGKVEHFRKSGIAVPVMAGQANYTVLQDVILSYQPHRVIFLGDLFHSSYNLDWEQFIDFILCFESTSFELVMGNHDVLHHSQYERTEMIVHQDELILDPFILTHHPSAHHVYYNLCGHIHPCYRMKGKSRQSLRLPCFYFGVSGGILPAMGSFTGMHAIETKEEDQIYVIADDQVIKID